MEPEFERALNDIQERVDIVEIISGYIPLKRAGRNFRALCPFHHEKTPSFMVNPDKQIYHCFGCGVGGNVINFVKRYERIEFIDAVKMLAQKTGVNLPLRSSPKRQSESYQLIYNINELAANFYNTFLTKSQAGKIARDYLTQKREILPQTQETFKLGYAPDAWESFLNFAKQKNISTDLLTKAGLILPGKEGSFYDRFRSRIIFPIFDAKSKVVAFGGRVLDESQPKYMNSPETEIYIKGHHLYGLNFAQTEIRQKDFVIIVEGYIDLLTPYQNGIKNIVATLGTALTQEHIRLLKRYTKNVVMVFDADEAGEAASLRGLDLLVSLDMDVKVASLPGGYDPDTFVKKFGAKAFFELIQKSKNLLEYKLGLLTSKYDPRTIEGKAKISEDMLPTINRLTNEVKKSGYIKMLSEILSINEEALIAELRKIKPDFQYMYQPQVLQPPKVITRPAEKILLGLILEDPQLITDVTESLTEDDFLDINIKKILNLLFELYKQNASICPSKLINKLQDDTTSQIISEALMQAETFEDKKKGLFDCINRLKKENADNKKAFIQAQIKIAQAKGEDDRVVELVTEYNNLIKKRSK